MSVRPGGIVHGDSDQREWIRSAVDQFEGPLTIYAARMVGGDVHRARDVVQDTFMRLWQADRSSVDGHLAKWLYTVCRNRALDVRRKEHRMTTLESAGVERAASGGDERSGGVETPAAEPGTGVVALVSGLPPRQQEAVRLKFQGGLSYREIAEVMDTTVNNVGVLLHTAIKTIRARLVDAGAAGDAPGAARVSAAR